MRSQHQRVPKKKSRPTHRELLRSTFTQSILQKPGHLRSSGCMPDSRQSAVLGPVWSSTVAQLESQAKVNNGQIEARMIELKKLTSTCAISR